MVVKTLCKVVLAFSGQRPAMLLNTLKCMGQSPKIKYHLSPNVNNALNICILEVNRARVYAVMLHNGIFHYLSCCSVHIPYITLMNLFFFNRNILFFFSLLLFLLLGKKTRGAYMESCSSCYFVAQFQSPFDNTICCFVYF